MDSQQQREALDRLIANRGVGYAAISKLLGRNAAYVQQFIKRGSPKRLEVGDRQLLARYFGVPESQLGGPEESDDAAVAIRSLSVRASAGPGAFDEDEARFARYSFDRHWLKSITSARPDDLSIIRVEGDSMAPALMDGDDILVDRADAAQRLRDGVYVLRRDDTLMVKRLSFHPADRTVTIASDNPAFPSWHGCDPRSIEVIGRVVWTGRRLG